MDFTISVMIMDMCIKSFLFIVHLEGGNFLFLIFSLEVCYHILDSMSPILVKQTNKQTKKKTEAFWEQVVYVNKWQDFQVFEILTHREKMWKVFA